MKRKRSNNKTQ